MNIMKKCGYCQQPAGLMCSRCLEVYCSVECQIRDWADHKKVCVVIPKLYPNDSYLDILAGGVALPLRPSSLLEQVPVRMLPNNGRALKPLRKPNVMPAAVGDVPVVINRDERPASSMSNEDARSSPERSPTKSVNNITVTVPTECNKRLSKMKLEEVPQMEAVNRSRPEPQMNEPVAQKPQTLTNLKQEITKNHEAMIAAAAAVHSVRAGVDQNGASSTASSVAAAPNSNQKKPWLLHFPLEKKDGEFFDVIVEYIVPGGSKRVWVILASHEAECDKLLRDIHGQLNAKDEPAIGYADIQVDDIYAAPYEDIYYRVVVLDKIDPAKNLVKVRLIDYGNEVTMPASDLRAPLLLMKNLRAFAFQIEIVNLDRPLQLCETIRVKVIRSESDRKVVEMEPNPPTAAEAHVLELLGSSEQKSAEGGIVSILSSRKALVMLSSPLVTPIMKVLYTQLPEAAVKFPPAANPKVGDMVCVDIFGVGWSRGVIIEQFKGNCLVYTVDNGTVELMASKDLRTLPNEYQQKARLVVQMELIKIVMNEQEFKRLCYMPSFGFSFERLGYSKEKCVIRGMMKDVEGKRLLAEIEFCDVVCDLKKLGIHYWPHIPQDKSTVRITSVLDVNTVIICPEDKINMYTDLLQTVLPELKRLTTAPNVKDVIIGVDDIMMPYRARVLKSASPSEVELLDLDNGCIKKVAFGKLYEANEFIRNLPVYTMKVQLRDFNVAAVKDQDVVIDQLEAIKTEKRSLKLLFDGGSYMYGVKLLDVNTNRSLAIILMERHDKKLLETEEAARKKREQEEEAVRQKAAAEAKARAEQERLEQERKAAQEAAARAAAEEKKAREAEAKRKEAEAAAKAASAAAIPPKITINDLKLIGLTTGKSNVKLNILDDSDLNQGIMTVCELTDDNIKRYLTLTDEVNKHAAAIGGDGYCPDLEELCVAIFDADKLWYRAVCLQSQPQQNVFLVQFIDYGNVASLKREAIRRLPKELAFPCAAHTCSVKDHKSCLTTLAQQQSQVGHVIAKEIIAEGDIYSLQF